MVGQVAARLHAYVHGLFRPTDKAETQALYQRIQAEYRKLGLHNPAVREQVELRLTAKVLNRLGLQVDEGFGIAAADFIFGAIAYENLFELAPINWNVKRSVSKWWEIREALEAEQALYVDFDNTLQALEDQLVTIIKAVQAIITRPAKRGGDNNGLVLPVTLMQSVEQAAEVAEEIVVSMLAPESAAWALFPRMNRLIAGNVDTITYNNPLSTRDKERPPVLPTHSKFKTAAELIKGYLGHTPILELLFVSDEIVLPQSLRAEHALCLAGSGHGKSQTLQYLICNDLEAVAAGDRSVVVIDSQGDLIRNIASLAEFGPEGPLHDRLVLIDPTDVEWPVSLNLFDVGTERLAGYKPLERERLTNSILELYDFVLGSLLSAEMTQKQNVIFRYVTRLMLVIPDATIHTLRELMEPDAEIKFAEHINKLSGSAKHFFKTEFVGREFTGTKKQVLRRLWGILENQTFERMFSHPRSKLDLYSELNSGKIILINTAKDLLKDQGSQIFGRFFIALITQAAQERATLSKSERLPTNVYIDEAADYFDQNIATMLAQNRKMKISITAAWQYLSQASPKVQEAFSANTSIKLAGGVSAKDARTLAPMLHCSPQMVESQPKGHFAAYIKGVTKEAVSVRFPFGYLEDKPKMTKDERQQLRDKMRERYAVHYSKIGMIEEEGEEPEDDRAVEEVNAPAADDVDITPTEKW